MAAQNNVPKDILDSMRESLDRRIKLSIKRLVNYCVKKDKIEKRVLAFSSHRLYIFTAKSAKDVKLETNFHYLDIKSVESKRPNQLVITISLMNKSFTFTTLEADTDEVDHMITHIGTSLKTVFPAFPVERFIKTLEVQPSSRLNLMNDLVKTIEKKETGPCGGFTLMYSCMCEFHFLPYRDEVAWDIDTIYLSQDSRELCLKDFDHLKERDLVPIVSALAHNTWFTSLNANNVKLNAAVCHEVLRVMKKNSVIEALLLSNTGITTDFIKKLSTLSMAGTQLHKLDLSNNPIEDEGAEHIFGALSSRGRRVTWLDLSKTRISSKGLNKIAELMSRSPHVFSSLQTLMLAGLNSGNKGDDLLNLYTFLASPNMISHLDLSGTDIELDKLMAPLQRGCSQNIAILKLSRTTFSSKKSKDVVVQTSFKQFFASVYALKHIDLSGAKLPAEALKDLCLGVSSNRNLKDVHLDISGMELNSQGAQNLQNSLNGNITSLNISNIGFLDSDLISVLNSIGEKKQIQQLAMGGVFRNTKPKNLKTVMEELVNVLQDEESVIESLSLADSKLRDSMNMIINALGSNTTLTEIDISGNQMGDLGARMLSKALQINNKLKTIYWDKNNTTSQGFDDIADALEKNFTLKKMPMPVHDASSNPEKAEQALQRIERLLQRNHSPQKYSSDQAYRLQQGFLISSTQQMVDRLVVQSQDTINALESMNALQSCNEDVEMTNALIKDADNSKSLLPRLRDIAIQSQNTSSPVAQKLKEISAELTTVLGAQMKKTVQDMLEATTKNCKALMKDKAFMSDVQSGCAEKSSLPKDFTSNILNDVDTDIFNKLSELNLAVAAHVSDRVIDEVIERLSLSHKTLTNHLNEKKREAGRRSQVSDSKKTDRNEANIRSKGTDSQADSPKMKDKRKSMHARKIRPQSVVDRDHIQIALDADKNRPVTVPQTTKTGSRSPKNRSPKPPRQKDKSQENDHFKPEKTPRKAPRFLKPSSRSPSTSPRSTSPVPAIAVTDTDAGDLDQSRDPLYDNVTPDPRHRKHRGHAREPKDGLDPPVPSISSTAVSSSTPDIDIGSVDLTSNAPKLNHQTKNRARRTKNVRPTTRQSGMPRTQSADAIKVDENVDEFFSKPTIPLSKVSEKKEETPTRTPSTKSTPESKKKLGGIFNFGHKDKEHDTKGKEAKKSGGFLAKLHGSPKSSPSPKKSRISEVPEEHDDLSINSNDSNVLTRSTTENTSLRGSVDKKSEKQNNEQTAVPKSASENISLNGSLGRKSNKSEKSEDSDSLKSDKSGSIDRRSDKSRDKSPVNVSETESEGNADKSVVNDKAGETQSENGTEKQPEKEIDKDSSTTENEEVKKVEKKALHPPSTKRSFNKADSKKESSSVSDEPVEEKSVANDENKESVKESKENKETEEIDTEKKEEEKDVKDEAKDSEGDNDIGTAEEAEEKKPLSVARKPGIPGGIGFGVNIMADLKAQQEKRMSKMPVKPSVRPPSDQPEKQAPSSEENKPAFGLHKLKPVSKTVPKESESNKNSVPVKPSDNKPSEPVKSTETPVQKNRAGSVETDVKNVTPEIKTEEKVKKNSSIKETSAEKPAATKRPTGLNKPPPPMRPKPPTSSKPTPAPRKSLSSSESTEQDEEINKPEKKTADSGVVYDSATLKMSVKDKISKFRSSGNETEAAKGKPLLQPEKKESVVRQSNTEDNRNLPSSNSESPDAGERDLNKVGNSEMTDSGIVADSPRTSVKEAMSRLDGKEIELKKHGSLPRNLSLEDAEKEAQEGPKRPRSMFAVVGSRPDLKKPTDDKPDIPEENDKDSPTEEVILV